jgi:hypothetical protein
LAQHNQEALGARIMNQDEIRTLLGTLDTQIAGVTALASTDDGREQSAKLASTFAALVRQLDLGEAPERRTCPHCGKSGMRKASICGFCWTKLAPLV